MKLYLKPYKVGIFNYFRTNEKAGSGLFFALHYVKCQRHKLKNDSKTKCNKNQIVLPVGTHQEPYGYEQAE
jgi:hypothetical protein